MAVQWARFGRSSERLLFHGSFRFSSWLFPVLFVLGLHVGCGSVAG